MGKKKLLSLDDLYSFYAKQNKDIKFSSAEDNSHIVVHINEPLVFKKEYDNDLNLKTYLRFCHTDNNINGSNISKESMKDAMPSVYNMPILGYIYKNEDGEYVFAGHEFYEDEDGETVYEEIPIGTIPESADLKLVYDEDKEKYYLEGYGIIWKTYSRAAEILEREKNLSVSVELNISELSYNAEKHVLNIEKFSFTGVTILQENRITGDEVKPGMVGASISLVDFSTENNSVFTEELINELKKFNKNFETLNDNKLGGADDMNKLKELLSKYNLTEEDLTFEVDGLSDEELEEKFVEVYGTDDAEPDNDDGTGSSDGDDDDASTGEENADNESSEDGENGENTYSLTLPDGTVKTFSLSLDDINNALFNLVNDTYSEIDNDFYNVTVYGDENKVVMYSWCTGNAYRQDYKRRKNDFSLEGERVAVKRIWVSEDEQKRLDSMKDNYSVMETKLSNYESEPEKIELLNSNDYSVIKETNEFAEISKRENYFELDKEDLAKKLDEILLSYAKAHNVNFSADTPNNETHIGMIPIAPTKKVSNYGSLLKDI